MTIRTAARRSTLDPDEQAVRAATRSIARQITLASSVLVLAVLVAAFIFVFSNVSASFWLNARNQTDTTIDVGAADIIVGGLVIGVVAVTLAAGMSLLASRRAVSPLGDALRAQRSFVADASHELRTPLTVLDARLQLLQRKLPEGSGSAPIVADLRRDAKTLIDIVNDLLAAAEVGGALTRHPVAVDVNPVVELAVESMNLLGAERGVSVSLNSTATVATLLPASSLHRCMIALLDNAMRYSPENGRITVTIRRDRALVTISVLDEGPGISGIDPERVFDRFARAEGQPDARASGTTASGTGRSGFGIGLALVRDLVGSVGGRAFVSLSSPQGTRVSLTLPIAARRQAFLELS